MTTAPTRTLRLRLERDPDKRHRHAGGTATYRAHLNQRWIGWVGDGRDRRGSRYGAQKWWGCWREDGDSAARVHSDLTLTTRSAAADWLLDTVNKGIRHQQQRIADAGNELRAVHACRALEDVGITTAQPAHGTHAGDTGQVAVDPDERLYLLRQLRAESMW